MFRSDDSIQLMQDYGNIDVYIESGLLQSQSTHGLVRHHGFLATQGGTLY